MLLFSDLPNARERSERKPRARSRVLMVAVASFLALGLQGCGNGGFQPLYGSLGGASVTDELASYDIAPIPGRVGQRIRNELVFQRTGGAPTAPDVASARVDVVIKESITSTLVTITGDSASQIYQLEVEYRIVDLKTQKVINQGRTFARAGFERHQAIYSNVRAREDAENRAAAHISGDLKTRLAAFAKARQLGNLPVAQ